MALKHAAAADDIVHSSDKRPKMDGKSEHHTEASSDPVVKSKLLSLPPELRTAIYEYALVEGEIDVTLDWRPPALLQACRQIRKEASGMYYDKNDADQSAKRLKLGNNAGAKTAKGNESSTQSKLLSLPPELRAAIFEYCLHEGEIQITAQLQQPGLLQTCKQLRAETLPMWYYAKDNVFHAEIRDCDASLYNRFECHVRAIGFDQDYGSTYRVIGKNWGNLVKWCEAVWCGESVAFFMVDDMDDEEAVVAAAHDIASRHSGRPWPECEAALHTLHFVVSKLKKGWV
ncbi:hypothetical protein LTR85_005571 [Meristemomyces frigidus]|nr:hypothetical protein LTR85_005571 [Meristemomyces frigidus]